MELLTQPGSDNFQYVVDIATVVTGVAAILIPVLVYLLVYLRRPHISLLEDKERIHSRLEGTERLWPHVRILVGNKGWRRAAHGSQVLAMGYRRVGDPKSATISLGSPHLGWPSASATAGAVTLFPGVSRPVDFGSLYPIKRDSSGAIITAPLGDNEPDGSIPRPAAFLPSQGGTWHLRLGIELRIADYREFLPPGAWIVNLVVGADDGSAHTYDVHVAWRGEVLDPRDALDYLLDHLEITRA